MVSLIVQYVNNVTIILAVKLGPCRQSLTEPENLSAGPRPASNISGLGKRPSGGLRLSHSSSHPRIPGAEGRCKDSSCQETGSRKESHVGLKMGSGRESWVVSMV